MRDMLSDGPHFSMMLLNAIFFVATKHFPSRADDVCGNGMSFRAQVEADLYDRDRPLVFESRLTTVQALLLMSDALYSWCDEKSLSWHYLGLAINMIFDLGLHTTRSRYYYDGSVEDHEVGRRIFWAAYGKSSKSSCRH